MAASAEQVPPDQVIAELGEAVDRMHQLLFLFTLWGDTFRGTGQRRDDALLSVGTRIDAQLTQLELHARVFQQVCETHPDWINEGVRAALDQQFSASEREEARRLLRADDDDFAASGAAIAGSFGQLAAVKREELNRATAGLQQVSADIDWHGLSCDLAAVVAMGGGAICVISDGAAVGSCVAGAAGAIYLLAAC